MSLERGYAFSHQDWQFTGYTLAGITTSVLCKNAAVCFDVGQGLPFQNSSRHILVTHAHLDHASGIPYLLAQKSMAGQKESNLYVPSNLAGPLEKILRIWQGLDEHEYSYQINVAVPGVVYDLDRYYSIKPFRTVHRVQSQGYLLYQKRKRLRHSFRSGDKEEILKAKARGEDPNEVVLDPVVAFTGDTQIEFFSSDADIARAKILFVEATFWDEERTVEDARKWGHIHLDEIIELLPRLKNERIVLIHTSVRYSLEYLNGILDRRLSAADRERVVIFPRPA